MSISISGHSVLPQTPADIPVLASYLQASKLQLPINRFLWEDWPNESAQRANYTHTLESAPQDPNVTRLKVVEHGSGEIVAHFVLSHRKPSKVESGPAGDGDGSKPRSPDGIVPELLEVVEEAIREINQEWKDTDHLELTWIYVRPTSRGKGIGSALVRLAKEKAQAAGTPLTVDAEPAAHAFFVKQGFQDMKHFDIDLSRWGGDNCGYGVFRLSGMKTEGT